MQPAKWTQIDMPIWQSCSLFDSIAGLGLLAELADATDSKSVSRKGVWVQVPRGPVNYFAIVRTISRRITYACKSR